MNERRDERLWDPRAAPDPEVERLERLLGRFAHRPDPAAPWSAAETHAASPAPAPALLRGLGRLVAAAAVVALIALLAREEPGPGYAVSGVSGLTRVHAGSWLETGADAARLEIDGVGSVNVAPETRVRVARTERDDHELFLARGGLEAFITAAPGVFRIDTEAATAIDLGCLYRVEVDREGVVDVRVDMGQVSLEGAGRAVIVPWGARSRAFPGRGPSAPVWEKDGDDVLAAVAALEDARDPDPAEVTRVLALVDQELTLWHLLAARSALVRRSAFDRLAIHQPPPDGLTRAAVEEGSTTHAARLEWAAQLDWFDAELYAWLKQRRP